MKVDRPNSHVTPPDPVVAAVTGPLAPPARTQKLEKIASADVISAVAVDEQ